MWLLHALLPPACKQSSNQRHVRSTLHARSVRRAGRGWHSESPARALPVGLMRDGDVGAERVGELGFQAVEIRVARGRQIELALFAFGRRHTRALAGERRSLPSPAPRWRRTERSLMAIFSASITCLSAWAASRGRGVAHLQRRLRSRGPAPEPPDQAGATGCSRHCVICPLPSAACSWVNENSAIRR